MMKFRHFSIFLFLLISCNSKSMKNQKAELLLDAKSSLGEGAIWQYERQQLYWVDIEKGLLNIYSPADHSNKVIDMHQMIGTVVPFANRNAAIVALRDGIYTVDLTNEFLHLIVSPEQDLGDNRFNDGKCDATGRFWAGTMALNSTPHAGSLYCVDLDGSARQMIPNVSISNGIIWSPDNTIMYYIDTPTRQIKAFDFDLKSGNISNGHVVVEVSEGLGVPDGMTIDENGKLWVAHWGGDCVCRWDPQSGKLLSKIVVPAPQVTSCAFGGASLDSLFITTARTGLSDEILKQYPLSGGLFVCVPGVKGVKANFYKGTSGY